MKNMIFTVFMLIGLLFMFSQKNDNESRITNFGSFYHTGVVRGIAVFLILISHIGDKSGLRFFTPLGGIGVSIFIICSGYGLYKSYLKNGLENYFRKRFVGLLIPYWIMVAIFSVVNFESVGIVQILKWISLLAVPSIFWYVQYVALLYIAFYLAFRFFKGKFGISLLLLFSLILFVVSKDLLLGEQSFAFVIGVMLANHNIQGNKIKIGSVGAAMIFVGAVNLVLKQTELIRNANYLVANFNGTMLKTVTALGILFLIYSMLNMNLLGVFTIAGKYSYELYLVHISLVGMLVDRFTLLNISAFIAISIIGTLLLNLVVTQITASINERLLTTDFKI